MKYRVIHRHVDRYSVRLMCGALSVSQSGYYAWRARGQSIREHENAQLLDEIRAIHQYSRCTYGSPRIWRALKARRRVGRHRIARLMRDHGIQAKPPRRGWRTSAKHQCAVAPNQLERAFQVSAPNRVWASDITYLGCSEGPMHLAVVLDLYSRAVIGWSMSASVDTGLVIRALQMALARRRPGPALLHHSDQGAQYASIEYQALLSKCQIQSSMSRKGNCWDNAVLESFFSTMKKEVIHGERFLTREHLRSVVFEWIEVFYNRQRLHSTLGYVSPAQFEARGLP